MAEQISLSPTQSFSNETHLYTALNTREELKCQVQLKLMIHGSTNQIKALRFTPVGGSLGEDAGMMGEDEGMMGGPAVLRSPRCCPRLSSLPPIVIQTNFSIFSTSCLH